MSVNVGNIPLSFVREITPLKRSKGTEINTGIGLKYTSDVAEFPTDILALTVLGNCLKINASTKDIIGQLEDISALVERFKEYNYIHNVNGLSGWMLLNSPDVDDHPFHSYVKRYTLGGMFFPSGKYSCRMNIMGNMPANDFSY